jgi:chromosome segregation ATPase
MNNEEKILELLQQQGSQMSKISADISELTGDVSVLKGDVSVLKGDVSAMKADISDLKGRISKVEITQENMVLPQIQAIAEGVSSVNNKLIARSELDSMKEEMAFLKDIIRMHTSQLNDLKKAR